METEPAAPVLADFHLPEPACTTVPAGLPRPSAPALPTCSSTLPPPQQNEISALVVLPRPRLSSLAHRQSLPRHRTVSPPHKPQLSLTIQAAPGTSLE